MDTGRPGQQHDDGALSADSHVSTGVQSDKHTADLRKVGGVTGSPNLERTPSMVGGRIERFCEIGSMIRRWEEMEGVVLEGGEECGGRREVRRGSKGICKLMGMFGDGGGRKSLEN